MEGKTRLELTWVGKNEKLNLEPRILLEDKEHSFHGEKRFSDNDLFDNRLIFGDNLLALKALEQEFTGEIKCIYIVIYSLLKYCPLSTLRLRFIR